LSSQKTPQRSNHWGKVAVLAVVVSIVSASIGLLWGIYQRQITTAPKPEPTVEVVKGPTIPRFAPAANTVQTQPGDWVWNHGQDETLSGASKNDYKKGLPRLTECSEAYQWLNTWNAATVARRMQASPALRIEKWRACFPSVAGLKLDPVAACKDSKAECESAWATLAVFWKAEALAVLSTDSATPLSELSEGEMAARLGVGILKLSTPEGVEEFLALAKAAMERNPQSTLGYKAYVIHGLVSAGEAFDPLVSQPLETDALVQDLKKAEPGDSGLAAYEAIRRAATNQQLSPNEWSDLYGEAAMLWRKKNGDAARARLSRCLEVAPDNDSKVICQGALDRSQTRPVGDRGVFTVQLGLPLTPPETFGSPQD